MLDRGFESFVGLYPIPMRHGLTIGELARLFNDAFGSAPTSTVVPMSGWRRDDVLRRDRRCRGCCRRRTCRRSTRRIVYPGQVLFEGTNALGRPRHDPAVRAVRRAGIDGRTAGRRAERATAARRRISGRSLFEPTFHKHAQDPVPWRPDPRHRPDHLRTGPGDHGRLHEMRKMNPGGVRVAPPPYEYEHKLRRSTSWPAPRPIAKTSRRATDPRTMADGWKAAVGESSGCGSNIGFIRLIPAAVESSAGETP